MKPLIPAIEKAREMVVRASHPGALGKGLADLRQVHKLSLKEFGQVVGVATAQCTLEFADKIAWYELAILELILLCDFYDICQTEELSQFCGGFIEGRMGALEDSGESLDQGRALGVTWVIRLTGYPLLYDYCSLGSIQEFAARMLESIIVGANVSKEARTAFAEELADFLIERVGADHGPTLERASLLSQV